MKTRILHTFLGLLVCISGQVNAQTIDRSVFTTNGAVYTTAQNGNTLYLGGSFSQLGYAAKKFVRYNAGSTKPDFTFPQLDNSSTLYAVEPDGNGGYYLGGNIYSYAGTKFNQSGSGVAAVIHILSDYSLDGAFTPVDAGGNSVYCIKKQGNRLYIGGYFYVINTETHTNIAAINPNTGALISWAPDEPDYSVNTIEASDSLVFLSGSFSNVGGNYAYGFAALKASTGKFTNYLYPGYNPAMKIKNNKLYLGGNFSSLGYQSQGIAKVSTASAGADLNFPQTNGYVYAILSDGGGGYYIGGSFSQVGNVTRNNLAHILSTGTVDPAFDPDVNTTVWCLASDGTNLYFGGDFTYVNAYTVTRNYAAAVSLGTGAVTSWDPSPDNSVRTMVFSGGTIYMGGYFNNVKAIGRNYAAAVTTANTLTNWAPNTDWYVNQILPNSTGTSFFICGGFSTVKGSTHPYVTKVNNTNGNPATWNPSPSYVVNSIALNGSRLYLGGNFSYVNGIYKQYVAEIDTSSNTPTSFQADANNVIYSLQVAGGKLYAGGAFTQIQNSDKNYCARIDLTSKTVDSWNPAVNNYVLSFASSATNILIGGYLNQVNSGNRNHIASVDLTTNQLTSYSPNVTGFSGTPNTFYFSGSELFCGGALTYYKSDYSGSYNGLVALDTLSGNITRYFDYTPSGSVTGLTITNNRLYAGGNFNTWYDSTFSTTVTRNYLGSYDLSANKLTSEIYEPNSTVRSLFTDVSGGLLVTGDFTLTSYVNRSYLAAIDLTTGQANTWNPHPDNQVRTMALKDTSLFIGGYFSYIYNSDYSNYSARQYLGAVSTNSGLATAWSADADSYVETLALSDTILYAGGSFTNVKGASRNYAAAIGTGGTGSVKTWAPNTNGYVRAIQPSGSNVYIGGDFTTVKGATKNYLASVNNTNGNLNSWNPNPNNGIYSLTANATTLYVGGYFSSISGQNRNSAVAYNIATNSLTSFNPRITNSNGFTPGIKSLAAYGKTLFIGSDGYYYYQMDSIKGTPRHILGGSDTTNGNATGFNPSPDNTVSTIRASGNKLVIGGDYGTLGISSYAAYFNVFNLEPLTQASALSFTNLQSTSVTANWTNGGGDGRIVIVREGAAAGVVNDGVGYTASAAFGQGSSIGNSYVVYKGNGNSVNVTNLRPNKTYYFAVYEYNGSGAATEYLQTPSLAGNVKTPCPAYSNIVSPPGPLSFCQGDSATLTAIANMSVYLWSNGATTRSIVVKTAGSYTVTITDSNGCSAASNTVVVTVNSNPTPTTNPSGTVNITSPNTVTISVNGTYNSYLWSNSATTSSITVGASGSYSVKVTNANGCSGTSAPVVVNVSSGCTKPTITAGGSITNVCPGKTVTLTSSSASSYLWSTGATTQSIVVSAAGSYTVTTGTGCTSDPSVVTYQACLPPTGLNTGSITATGAKISWTAAQCAVGYQYQWRKKGTTAWTTATTTATTRNITGLTASTTYQWRVLTGCKITPDTVASANATGPEFTTLAAAIPTVNIKQQMNNGGSLTAKLFPNPAHDYATLQLSGNAKNVSVRLTDMAGKTIWQMNNSNSSQLQIPVSRLSNGTYLLNITSGAESKVLKLVKE